MFYKSEPLKKWRLDYETNVEGKGKVPPKTTVKNRTLSAKRSSTTLDNHGKGKVPPGSPVTSKDDASDTHEHDDDDATIDETSMELDLNVNPGDM